MTQSMLLPIGRLSELLLVVVTAALWDTYIECTISMLASPRCLLPLVTGSNSNWLSCVTPPEVIFGAGVARIVVAVHADAEMNHNV